jgi:hypothetical protein
MLEQHGMEANQVVIGCSESAHELQHGLHWKIFDHSDNY